MTHCITSVIEELTINSSLLMKYTNIVEYFTEIRNLMHWYDNLWQTLEVYVHKQLLPIISIAHSKSIIKIMHKQLLPIISIAHSKSIIKIMLENIQTTVAKVFHSKCMILFTSLPWFPSDKFLCVLQLILSRFFF